MRQRSTLAHALAHFVFNDWADYGGGNWDRRSNGVLRADAFGQASVAWSKPGQYMQVLSDEWTDDLARAVSDVARMPMGDRMKTSKDLVEIMVIAHALVAAKAGADVTVLIDDGAGRQLASAWAGSR